MYNKPEHDTILDTPVQARIIKTRAASNPKKKLLTFDEFRQNKEEQI